MKAMTAWENGTPLWESLFVYGKTDTIARFRAAMDKPAMPGIVASFAGLLNAETDSKDAQATMAATQTLLKERADLEKRLKAEVVMRLRNGGLIGLAFEVPRTLNSEPVTIPRALWLGQIDWRQSTLKHDGLSFVAVRIGEPEQVDLPEPTSPGRPSRRPEIVTAFQQLVAEGAIDHAQSLTSHFPAVRSRVKEISGDDSDKGLGDKALYATLSPLYERQT